MNAVLEQKLRELIDDSKQLGAPAMYTVLRLLLSAHLNATHNKFAKHCCQFSHFITIEMDVSVSENTDDPWSGKTGGYYH